MHGGCCSKVTNISHRADRRLREVVSYKMAWPTNLFLESFWLACGEPN